jgi:hypothetical protein
MFGVKRREFIALLGGAAAALPLRVALTASILICPALARDDGRFNHLPVDLRDWFRAQKSPMTGEHCCDEADGTYVEEDIREGHYWVRWSTVGKWQRVPDEVIIHGPNRVGLPVVWWYYDHLGVRIRCFVPGGKT